MKTKNINMNEAQATGKIALTGTPTDRIHQARVTADAIKANAGYASHPEVQQVTTAMSAATDAFENNVKALAALRSEEKALLTSHIVLAAALKRSAGKVVAVITDTSQGSAESIKGWGLEVAGRQPVPASSDPPTELRAIYPKGHSLVIRWKAVKGSKGYEVQIGDGTPQGWGPAIHSSRARLEPTGLVAGQKVVVRVAAHRPNGTSAYSDPVTMIVH